MTRDLIWFEKVRPHCRTCICRCILRQSMLSVEWRVLKAPLSGAKWESFCCRLLAIQTSELNRRCMLHCRQIYIETILWWDDLIWHVTLAPFFPFIFGRTNQSCFCGDYRACLSFTGVASADRRWICTATNQQDDVFSDFPSWCKKRKKQNKQERHSSEVQRNG